MESAASRAGGSSPASGATWRESAGREAGADGYQFGDFTKSMLGKVRAVPAAVVDPLMASMCSDGTSDDRSWKEASGRKHGGDGYVPFDWTRGLVNSIMAGRRGVASSADSLDDEFSELTSINMDDLEPANLDGKPIPEWKIMRPAGMPLTGTIVRCVPQQAVLGEGSYGKVWLGVHKPTGKKYAVKNINLEKRRAGKAGSGEMAKRECEVSQKMLEHPHPCIVLLLDVHHFQDNDMYSLVMEFCPGGDLQDKIASVRNRMREGYERPNRWQKYLVEVFLGLEHMHLKVNALLRDLKPENVVMAENGVAKITDFGFGRQGVESAGTWSFGMPTGSPGYCSPEILMQEHYDDRADLYSFGVLCWVLLTGGVTTDKDPRPPIGSMTRAGDFRALAGDWKTLAEAIADPAGNQALALVSEDEKDFILRLTCEKPENRLRHEAIRQHPFITPLQLPAADASHAEAEAWATACMRHGP